MAFEKPQIGIDIELGFDLTFAVFATLFRNMRDAVQHEHIGHRQAAIGRPEHVAVSTIDKIFVAERIRPSRRFKGSIGI
jgi:hypothetical protein